jgi:hypothetical protein
MNTAPHLGVFLLALVAAAQAVAQSPQLIDFRSLDTNHDGRISSVEGRASADLQDNFDALDKNQDGYLSPTEFAAWPRASKDGETPADPTTGPSGSRGAQHMPAT